MTITRLKIVTTGKNEIASVETIVEKLEGYAMCGNHRPVGDPLHVPLDELAPEARRQLEKLFTGSYHREILPFICVVQNTSCPETSYLCLRAIQKTSYDVYCIELYARYNA